jgi:hypothetical protein
MAGIREGTLASRALTLLGQPDERRTNGKQNFDYPPRIKEVWCYGTCGHLTFPTLGQVYIDHAGKVDYVAGSRGSPPDPGMIDERRMRELLTLLDRTPRACGLTYNPRDLIKVVNSLVPIGKARALAVISEYLRVAPEWPKEPDGICLVLRVLFNVPASQGYIPAPLLGSPWPETPMAHERIPRFPMVVLEDVPLMLVSEYGVLGTPVIAPDLDFFRRNCEIRSNPLRPTNQPFIVLEKLIQSKQWIYSADRDDSESSAGRILLINQLLRLVNSAYHPEVNFEDLKPAEKLHLKHLWNKEVKKFPTLGILWDSNTNQYVLKAS